MTNRTDKAGWGWSERVTVSVCDKSSEFTQDTILRTFDSPEDFDDACAFAEAYAKEHNWNVLEDGTCLDSEGKMVAILSVDVEYI